ncbi:lipopolysaccharide biosynthesis protein [Micromonospora sp. NPDC047740]|uniref:lipopolysaccharide biosynthesis protein n=1 Tax=Micromonospora sp. NPDC047740 TaxID=3364254 RepID=UPI0037183712
MLIPLTLSYLGADLYGLWMAVAAVTGMAAFADLGLGNSLMTRLSVCQAAGDVTRARCYVATAYLALSMMALGVCAMLWLFAGVVPWSSLFNVAQPALNEDARLIALVCLTAFIVNVPLSLIVRVQYAYQRVARSNLWQTGGNLLALPLAIVAVRADLSPAAVVGAVVVAPLLGNLVTSFWTFARELPGLRPRLRYVRREVASSLLGLGGAFLALTVVMSLAANVDALIVAHVLGLRSTTSFAVPARLFAQVGLLVSMINTPLWTANGDALARGHVSWVRRSTRRMTLVSLVGAALPAVVLVAAGDLLLGVLVGEALVPDRWLLAGLACWWTLMAVSSPCFMVQNAAGLVPPQLWGWTLYLLLSVPAKWFAADHWGVAMVPWAGVAIGLVTLLPAALLGYRRVVLNAGRPAGDLAVCP